MYFSYDGGPSTKTCADTVLHLRTFCPFLKMRFFLCSATREPFAREQHGPFCLQCRIFFSPLGSKLRHEANPVFVYS